MVHSAVQLETVLISGATANRAKTSSFQKFLTPRLLMSYFFARKLHRARSDNPNRILDEPRASFAYLDIVSSVWLIVSTVSFDL